MMPDDNVAMQDSQESETNSVSSADRSQSSTSKARVERYNVNDTGLKKISDLVAAQLRQDAANQAEMEGTDTPRTGFISPSDTMQAPQTQENQVLYKYRITLYPSLGASPHTVSMLELFKSFAYELMHIDKHAVILPLDPEHASFTHITSVKQIQAMDSSRMKIYFSPWAKNQIKSLSGNLLIQSVIHPDYLNDVQTMGEWLIAHEYTARPSINQNEEMKVIGCLPYSHQFINRDNLTQAILADEAWNPEGEEDFGVFHLSLRDFKVDNTALIKLIFVSTETSKMEKMTNFFSSLYDGSTKRYPYSAPFLFVPLYKCNLSKEFREQLIRMHQDRIGESLKAWTVKGWHSLDAEILLQGTDGSTMTSTVKDLLLSLPASPGMVTPTLFVSIEPQINSTYFLAVYAAANEDLLEGRLKSLTKDIYKLLAPGEGDKFFLDPLRGLSFGRDINQYVPGNIALQNTSPSSAMQLMRLTNMLRSPSTKRTSSSDSNRSTRQKPAVSTRTSAMTASYSGVTQTNTTSFSTPTASFSSSSETHEVSITVERRIVSIETRLDQHRQRQDAMSEKLDSIDELATESNVMLKQMMDNLKITPINRGSKRDKPMDADNEEPDDAMGSQRTNP